MTYDDRLKELTRETEILVKTSKWCTTEADNLTEEYLLLADKPFLTRFDVEKLDDMDKRFEYINNKIKYEMKMQNALEEKYKDILGD